MQKWANFKVKIFDLFIVCYFILQQKYKTFYSRPWPAVCITFVQITHQIQVLTEPLNRAQAFYALLNNEAGTKYRGLTYSVKQNCP